MIGIVASVVAVDQLTKAWAVAALPGDPRRIIDGVLELRLARNRGGAFGLFEGYTALLGVLAAVVAVVVIRLIRQAHQRLVVVALSLVLGGALGNLGDRVVRDPGWFRGAVVDFVKVDSLPTFNVADAAITVGAVLLVVWALRPGPSSVDAQP